MTDELGDDVRVVLEVEKPGVDVGDGVDVVLDVEGDVEECRLMRYVENDVDLWEDGMLEVVVVDAGDDDDIVLEDGNGVTLVSDKSSTQETATSS